MKRKLSFYDIIYLVKNMKTVTVNSFDNVLKYKLYRTVYEVVHPTISKKNISSYRIMFGDNILPVRVFYPTKVSNIEKVIIYTPGVAEVSGCLGDYAEICKKVAHETQTLVIALDLDDIGDTNYFNIFDHCSKTAVYLCLELQKLGISSSNIILMGDSIGASIAMGIGKDKCFSDSKLILFYPVLSADCLYKDVSLVDTDVMKKLQKYYKKHLTGERFLNDVLVFPKANSDYQYSNKILFIVGGADPLKNDILEYYEECTKFNQNCELREIDFYGHGFLDELDDVAFNEVFGAINDFLK